MAEHPLIAAIFHIHTVAGRPVLVAGPWATGNPIVVDPSYFSPRAYADLDRADPDPRWGRLAATSRVILGELTDDGHSLVPDWATVPSTAGVVATPASGPAPGSSGPPSSGLDAVRVAPRTAESCVSDDRRMAAALWPLYRRAPGRESYALDGRPLTGQEHPASFVAAAAAAQAAGDGSASERLLAQASSLNQSHPTYYGSAWVALGRVMLTSSALGTCAG